MGELLVYVEIGRPESDKNEPGATPIRVSTLTKAKQRQGKSKQSKSKQSKAKQSTAEQSKAKQSKAKQSKAEQSNATQSKAEQSKAKHSRAKQSTAEQSKAKPEGPPGAPRARQGARGRAKGPGANAGQPQQ